MQDLLNFTCNKQVYEALHASLSQANLLARLLSQPTGGATVNQAGTRLQQAIGRLHQVKFITHSQSWYCMQLVAIQRLKTPLLLICSTLTWFIVTSCSLASVIICWLIKVLLSVLQEQLFTFYCYFKYNFF